MKRILIGGDSWGCGEWNYDVVKEKYCVSHLGFESYLREDGHDVINVSEGATRNDDIINKLIAIDEGTFAEKFGDSFPNLNPPKLDYYDYIFIFVTDYFRAAIPTIEMFWKINSRKKDILKYHKIRKEYFFKTFDNIRKPIYLIGGLSKVTYEDIEGYSNLRILIPSVIEFLYPDERHHEVCLNSYIGGGNYLPESLGEEYVDYLYEQIKLYDRMHDLPFFIPDGNHPNRDAHRLIYEEAIKLF